jgi:hypothetical protein
LTVILAMCDPNLSSQSDDSTLLIKTKDEEKRPLLITDNRMSSPIKHMEDGSVTVTSGEEGDNEEDDSNDSDVFGFATRTQVEKRLSLFNELHLCMNYCSFNMTDSFNSCLSFIP